VIDIKKRLELYLKEAFIHIQRLEDVLEPLNKIYPLDSDKYEILEDDYKDKLDVLAFRFSKLQDLLGSKIFRAYLESAGFVVEEKSFNELLKELEKEKILDIDLWSEFRGVRNAIAHDYPYDHTQKIEAINYLIANVKKLIYITKNIRQKSETF
jgi:hypothetical protein